MTNRVVAGRETPLHASRARRLRAAQAHGGGAGTQAQHPEAQPVEIQVDDRGGVEGEQLADDQPADDGDAERAAQLTAGAQPERQRQPAEQISGGK